MLKNIKSEFFIELLFSFIDEGIKLKSVRYNKALQKAININIINYKLFKGTYIVIEENGIVKEYNSFNNNLIFEGEYKDRKRHGKGKEYNIYNGKKRFDVEYLNGKRIRKIQKEYKGNLIFEGEYLNG